MQNTLALSLNLSLSVMIFEILTFWELLFLVLGKSAKGLAMRSSALLLFKSLVLICKIIWSGFSLINGFM